ncbi:hypothetical protein [Chromobacterium violaceum]|uniref:hypothetical protein n=1 Tax=Chromobacterium violaceum TaxID=536 RepID=UPI001B31AE57|nr:hypothetical protein [Chromobacterium violaceum]MBP4043936.1 hypothetical protein [Chromobacterium violaceum]
MKWGCLFLISMAFCFGCNRVQEKEQDVVVDNRPQDRIIVYAEKRVDGIYLDLKAGVEEAKKSMNAKEINLVSLSMLKSQVKGKEREGWVVLNNNIPLNKCRAAMPDEILYGQEMNRCLTVKSNNKYEKSADYEIYLSGTTDELDSVDFQVEYKKYY